MGLATSAIKSKILKTGKYERFFYSLSFEEVRKVNNELIKCLEIFDEICRKNGLKYFLVAGALIGAVREKKCVPWDDDIDLFMPLEDYLKIGEILKNNQEYSNYMMVYPYENNVITMGAHFYCAEKNLSEVLRKNIGNSNVYENVAYLDIVPIHNCINDTWKEKLNGLLVDCIQMSYISRRCFKKNDEFLWYLSKYSMELRINRIIRIIFSLPSFLFTKKAIFAALYKLINRSDEAQYVTASFGALRYFGEKTPKDYWYPVAEMEFEGMTVMVPNKPESYLKHRYGDFMTVPNEKEQEERMRKLKSDWKSYIGA